MWYNQNVKTANYIIFVSVANVSNLFLNSGAFLVASTIRHLYSSLVYLSSGDPDRMLGVTMSNTVNLAIPELYAGEL